MSQVHTNNTPSENAASRKDDNVSSRKAKITSSASVRNNSKVNNKARRGSFSNQQNDGTAEPSSSRLSMEDFQNKKSQGGAKRGGDATVAVNNSVTVSNWSESMLTNQQRQEETAVAAVLGKLSGEPECGEMIDNRTGNNLSAQVAVASSGLEEEFKTTAANKPASPASRAPDLSRDLS